MLVVLIFELGLLLLFLGAGMVGAGAAGMRFGVRPACVSLAAMSYLAGWRVTFAGLYFAIGAWATTGLVWVIVRAVGGN